MQQAWVSPGERFFNERLSGMVEQVWLTDVDRPDEPLRVEIEAVGERVIRLRVANTAVRFNLTRVNGNPYYHGSLGGREFVFDPSRRGISRDSRR